MHEDGFLEDQDRYEKHQKSEAYWRISTFICKERKSYLTVVLRRFRAIHIIGNCKRIEKEMHVREEHIKRVAIGR